MADDNEWKVYHQSKRTKRNLRYENPQLLCVIGLIDSGRLSCLIDQALDRYIDSKFCPVNCLSRKINYRWIYRPIIKSQTHSGYGLLWVNHPSLSWLLLGLTVEGEPSTIVNPEPELQLKLEQIKQELKTCHWLDREAVENKKVKVERQLCQPLRLARPVYSDEEKAYIQSLNHVYLSGHLSIITGWVQGPKNPRELVTSILYTYTNDNVLDLAAEIKEEYLIFCSPAQQKNKHNIQVRIIPWNLWPAKRPEQKYLSVAVVIFPSAVEGIFAFNLHPEYKNLRWRYMPKSIYHQVQRTLEQGRD